MSLRLLIVATVLVAFAILVLPAVFVGAGFLLSLVLPLSVFQCSVLSLGSAFLAAVIFFAITRTPWALDSAVYDKDDLDYEDYEDYDPFEDDEDEDFADFERANDEVPESDAPSSPPKVGRNAPCLCGSGKKFKHCCGRP